MISLRFNDVPETKEFARVDRTMSFGLTVRDQGKRLMFDDRGRSNNTCVRIDGREIGRAHV